MKNKMKKIIRNDSLLFTILSITASGINFITLIIFGRIFSVDDYGIVTGLQAFLANVAVFIAPIQILLCKQIAENNETNEDDNSELISSLIVINVIVILVMLCLTRGMQSYLDLENSIDYFIFVVLILINNLSIALNGILQGKQKFLLLGNASILLYLIKLLVSYGLGKMGIGLIAVIWGTIIAEMICVIIIIKELWLDIKQFLKKYKFTLNTSVLKSYFWTFIVYMIVSIYMNNGDLLLAKVYCNKQEIGLYSVVINLAKISVYLIVTPIATIMLPKIAASKNDIRKQKKILYIGEGITLFISILYAGLFCICSKWIINLLYGSDYHEANKYVIPCVTFCVVLGVFYLFYQYVVATEKVKEFTITTVSIGIIVIITLLINRYDISYIPIVMSIGMFCSTLLTFIIIKMKEKRENNE